MFSIVITVLNEQDEINQTVESIRATAGNDAEIVIIDDNSTIPIFITDKKAYLHRNKIRQGVGKSRHLGVSLASNKYIAITDGHMRFTPGWLNNTLHRVVGRETTIHCATCLGLDSENMDVNNPRGEYAGARISLCEKNKEGNYEILESKWIKEREDDDYMVGSIMGAFYIFTKDFFYKIRGLHSLCMYGSDEPYLSIKAWLAGGDVRMIRNVKIGHKFRNSAPYSTPSSNMIYNKLRMLKTIIHDDYLSDKIIDKFNKDKIFETAIKMIEDDRQEVNEYCEYYKSIFKYDINWLIKKFDIKLEL